MEEILFVYGPYNDVGMTLEAIRPLLRSLMLPHIIRTLLGILDQAFHHLIYDAVLGK